MEVPLGIPGIPGDVSMSVQPQQTPAGKKPFWSWEAGGGGGTVPAGHALRAPGRKSVQVLQPEEFRPART